MPGELLRRACFATSFADLLSRRLSRIHSTQERNDFEAWDKQTGCRAKFVEVLKKEFAHLSFTYSIGGQISFDVFPTGESGASGQSQG